MDLYDDFLSENDLNSIIERVTGPRFPWYLGTVVPKELFKENLLYNFQFGHILFNDETGNVSSGEFNYFTPLLLKLNIKVLYRMKINLNPIASKIMEHGYHVDNHIENCKTSIFYLNTNNGYTKFEETGEKIKSVKNRLITFKTSKRHTGTTCTDASQRLVLNINYS